MNAPIPSPSGYATAIERLADALAVPQDRFDQAESRYKDLGEWLHRPESTVRIYDPDVHIQGSFALGTPIKPASANEDYDLDIVIVFRSLSKADISQARLRDLLRDELEAYRKARNMKNAVGESRRCCTLSYADGAQFHMDVLPSLPDAARMRAIFERMGGDVELGDDGIVITDNETPEYRYIHDDWMRSNPRGYAKWFISRMIQRLNEARQKYLEKSGNITASVEDVPVFRVRTPLQSTIMILKRHRDEMFSENPDVKPISIIITTLTAKAYDGEGSVAEALDKILRTMHSFIEKRGDVLWVANPSNPEENFADRWETHPERQTAFFEWLKRARTDFVRVAHHSDAKTILTELQDSFGEALIENAKSGIDGLSAPAIHTGRRTTSTAPVAGLSGAASSAGLSYGSESRKPTEPKGFG